MNKLQKRELRKKRHKRQQYLKHEAPLNRLERALGSIHAGTWLCQAIRPVPGESDVKCILPAGHAASVHEGRNAKNLPVLWRIA